MPLMMMMVVLRVRVHRPPPPPPVAARRRRTTALLSSRRPAPPPPDEDPLAVHTVALEEDDVAGIEPLLLHVAAPPFGQHVALATTPVRIPEANNLKTKIR